MDNLLPPVLAALASLGFLWLSLHLRGRHRLLRDLPTSKAEGVFIGLVELQGTAEAEKPLHSPLARRACVHYAYDIAERWSRTVTETYQDSQGKTRTRTRRESGWKTIATGGETIPFYVRDDTGAVRVEPKGATLKTTSFFSRTVSRGDPLYLAHAPAVPVPHSDHVRRFVETGIALHAPLYVVGRARERSDVVAPEIAADPQAPLFLISTQPEDKVLRGYAVGSWLVWLLALGAAVVSGLWFAPALGRPEIAAPAAVAAGAVFLGAWGTGWVWLVYNSLISLRERMRQGWSLIDVQLKRRHDLIPGLAAVLTATQAHERDVQTALATLRTQAQASAPGEPGPDPHGVARDLRVVIERYPTLQADAGFARLHRELVQTEQRIALARTYYNDLATHYATRLEQVPDRWVAALGRLSPAPLLAAADFERAEVRVTFSDEPA